MRDLTRKSSFGGSTTIMSIGVVIIGLSASVFAIDLPAYFNARNELQTAVDAAALAGAAKLPVGETQAQDAAYELASQNSVAGMTLEEANLSFKANKNKFTVSGEVEVPTIIGKFLCAVSGKLSGREQEEDASRSGGSANSDHASCTTMKVVAYSSAAPAARDTILVIDTSSSMDDLGNNRPMKDIKSSATNFINTIASLDNESVDRIGLVSFNQTGTLQSGLTSQTTSAGFSSVKTKISNLKLFTGTGWNTNYETGLKVALDELQARGRKNARKSIIFMTDGMPNVPAPDSYYSYNRNEPYLKCVDMVNNSSAVKAKCVTKNGQKVCPVLPSSQITASMIPANAFSCVTAYVEAMTTKTNTQTDRAKTLDVTIHTISLYDSSQDDGAQAILRAMLKAPNWRPTQLEYMADTTDGQQYEAANYDVNRIQQIYATIAQDINIKLVN